MASFLTHSIVCVKATRVMPAKNSTVGWKTSENALLGKKKTIKYFFLYRLFSINEYSGNPVLNFLVIGLYCNT